MKRQFIAGVMGLALAGCAHSRSEVPKGPGTGNPVGPVGMQPIPSIHDSVNRGMGNAALAQGALGDPNDPRWSGRAPAPSPDPNRPGASDTPRPSQTPQPAQMAAAAPADVQPNWSQSQVTQSPRTSYSRNPSPPADLAATGAGMAQPTQLPPQTPGASERLNPTPPMDVIAAAAATGLPAGAAASALNPSAAGTRTSPDGNSLSPSTVPGLGAGPETDAQASAGAGSIPSTLERPGGLMPDMLTRPGGSQGPPSNTPAAGPAVAVGDAAASPGAPAESGPGGPRITGPSVNGLEPIGPPPASLAGPATAPTDPAVSPSAGPNSQARGAATPGPAPAGDPLLGPNPDLMPQLPPLPDVVPAAKAAPAGAAAPGSAPTAGGPASAAAAVPALAPATGATDTPPALVPTGSPAAPAPTGSPETAPAGAPGDSPPDLGPPAADNRPDGSGPAAGAVQVAGPPALTPVPPADKGSGAIVRRTAAPAASPVPAQRTIAHRDPQVLRTSLQKAAGDSSAVKVSSSWRGASVPVARVGDEVITLHDLQSFVHENAKARNIDLSRAHAEDKTAIYKSALWQMVNQALLIQEAKRALHNPKHWDQFTQELDKHWKEVELPQLENQFAAEDEHQLREKFKERGRSLDVHYKSFRRTWMAENFLHAKLKNRLKADLPELLKYYEDHKRDASYDRPDQIVWHEIVVEARRYPSPDEARKKAGVVLDRLRHGADFARLAQAESDGPSRSREQGGLMETSPGSYGVAAVNDALLALPIGQVSRILEGPQSFHIVRVDRRRAAGPAPFEELQDEIRTKILEQKYQAERAAFMAKLRQENPTETYLDGLEREPSSSKS